MVSLPQEQPGPFTRIAAAGSNWCAAVANQFDAALQAGQRPRIADYLGDATGGRREALLFELVQVDHRHRWAAGEQPRVEEYIDGWPELQNRLLELLRFECKLRRVHGAAPTLEELSKRFPGLDLATLWADLLSELQSPLPGPETLEPGLPEEKNPAAGKQDPEGAAATSPGKTPPAAPAASALDVPARIGRYALRKELGSGSFGTVYLGHDEQMDRPVAIKVPSPELLRSHHAREEFLREARSAARLRHPATVVVHDFGEEPDGTCYIVYEFIEGKSLAERILESRVRHAEAALLTAQIAEALHHAHLHGLVHRDIKPSNILLDVKGNPYLADFGLAIREDELARQKGAVTGTPAYMAPEQVRGEGHRTDPRTDIYGLGVVLYELLCGRCPFWGASFEELFEQILEREPRPPRTIDDSIPRELEWICLKAISKRMIERHTTALDMAQELRQVVTAPAGSGLLAAAAGLDSTPRIHHPPAPGPGGESLRRVPRGARPRAAHPVRPSPQGTRGEAGGPPGVLGEGHRGASAVRAAPLARRVHAR